MSQCALHFCSYIQTVTHKLQGDHSPDNVKFHDNSPTVHGTPANVKCYSYHAGNSFTVSRGVRMQQCIIHMMCMKFPSSARSRMDANMQLTINSFRPLFPGQHFFPWHFPDFCKIPDISRFSRQVVTLLFLTPPPGQTARGTMFVSYSADTEFGFNTF